MASPQLVDATLLAHNHQRRNYQADPLEWDGLCYETAQRWAETLARGAAQQQGGLSHGGLGKGMGQNLWWSSDETASPLDAVAEWMAEARSYNRETPTDAGHFTQVVWKKTRKVGLGIVRIPRPSDIPASDDMKHKYQYGTFVVANYFPHGNARGKYDENVGTPQHSPGRVTSSLKKQQQQQQQAQEAAADGSNIAVNGGGSGEQATYASSTGGNLTQDELERLQLKSALLGGMDIHKVEKLFGKGPSKDPAELGLRPRDDLYIDEFETFNPAASSSSSGIFDNSTHAMAWGASDGLALPGDSGTSTGSNFSVRRFVPSEKVFGTTPSVGSPIIITGAGGGGGGEDDGQPVLEILDNWGGPQEGPKSSSPMPDPLVVAGGGGGLVPNDPYFSNSNRSASSATPMPQQQYEYGLYRQSFSPAPSSVKIPFSPPKPKMRFHEQTRHLIGSPYSQNNKRSFSPF